MPVYHLSSHPVQILLPLKKKVRAKEDILAGDTIKISYRVAIGAEI